MTLTWRQKKILKKWLYCGPDRGNYLDGFSKHETVCRELETLGLVFYEYMPPATLWGSYAGFPGGALFTSTIPGHYTPRLTDTGICARRELVPDTPYA